MRTSEVAYITFLLAVGGLRLVELRVSRRNQARLLEAGAQVLREPRYPAMVALHTSILLASAAEVVFLARPFVPALAVVMALLLVATNALRWWVIHTLAGRWSVRVLTPSRLGIVTAGPFRFVRHPNYGAVFLEMLAIPLLHAAWLTALLGALAHVYVLRARIQLEETVLMADAGYRAAMGGKPRFVPGLF
jgi:methyltransferase